VMESVFYICMQPKNRDDVPSTADLGRLRIGGGCATFAGSSSAGRDGTETIPHNCSY
jgi:hypothetical protein